jgi:hydrogenase nickel incorporation protein HypA/HybF
MHEWALAESVISTVQQHAENEGLLAVHEVTIHVGELQNIDLEIFKFALCELRSLQFENTIFQIEVLQTELRCRACTEHWKPHSETLAKDVAESIHFVPEIAHAYIKCPHCGSPDFEVLAGRGVWLQSIQGEKA